MKHSAPRSGFRLVQRKFAQGVPIPASSAPAAPPPPEKKNDAPAPPRSVYQNNISARSLLDIVALQSLHKHVHEPLVLLKRLREDEIQSAFTTPMRGPARRRRGLKANKNKMALRSGKRKSPEAPRAANKRRRKNASESTDDVPLAYYEAQKRRVALVNKERQAKRVTRARAQEKEKRTSNGQMQVEGASDEASSTAAESEPPLQRRKTLRRSSGERRSEDTEELRRRVVRRRGPTLRRKQIKSTFAAIRKIAEEGRNLDEAGTSVANQELTRPRITLGIPLRRKSTAGKKSNKATRLVERVPAVKKVERGMPSTLDSTVEEKSDQASPLVERASTAQRYETGMPSKLESTDMSEDGNFTFKEPRNPVPLSYRRFKEQRAAAAAAKGRPFKKFVRPSCLRTSPRTTPTQPSPTDEENGGVAKRLRNKLVLEEEPSPTPECEPEEESEDTVILSEIIKCDPTLNDDNVSISSMKTLVLPVDETAVNVEMQKPTDELTNDQSGEVRDWCIENARHYAEYGPSNTDVDIQSAGQDTPQAEIPLPEPPLPDTHQTEMAQEEITQMEVLEPVTQDTEETADQRSRSEALRESVEQYADSELETLNVVKQKMLSEKEKNKAGPSETPEKRSTRNRTKKQTGKKTHKKTQKKREERAATNVDKEKKRVTRASVATKEAAERMLRNTNESVPAPVPSTSADVYEFDAEREASRPPSGLRARRNQPEPSAPPTVAAQDIIEFIASQTQKRESPFSSEKKKAIIENLSSSPSLLDKFLNCLSPEIQTELDKLIQAEQASGGMVDVKNEYLDPKPGLLMEAHTFRPTEEEFADPILYIEKITAEGSVHGLCKIIPPDSYKPPCNISDTIRFAVIYQYISKMYSRWGPVTRELAAIKAHLRTQSVVFARSPLLDGSEVNLPKLYHVVERHGGLNNVMQRKRWGRVADEMKLTRLQHPERKLDPIYMRYLLPYATLSDKERQTIMSEVEKHWTLKYQKMLKRARNPFQRQARMLSSETENESSDDERDDNSAAGALREAEDCIVPGRIMNLATFKKIATTLMDAHFDPKSQPPNLVEVEKAYWRAVLLGTDHIVANTASIDTGEEGYGFPKDPEADYGTHPWNLKVLARNPNNVLRYLGEVLGVTVPTLHLNMLFSTSCWHRDPHGLPWIEYMHSGAEKIWYGIPRNESANFRRAVETLCPAYCQNKSIWLASEITMIPPNILSEHQVRLSRLIQRPGEYVLVFPEAHSCSITTGFGVSESVYFASDTWLCDVYKLFQELRNSCEPTMFSLEQLLLSGSRSPTAPPRVCAVLATLLAAELDHRRALEAKGLQVQERPPSDSPLNTSYFRALHARDHDDECEYCRCTLYLSKVTGLTGRNSAVCPEHALRLLETKKHKNIDVSTLEFLSSYSTRSLEELVEELEARSVEPIDLIDLTATTPVMEEPQPGTSQQAT